MTEAQTPQRPTSSRAWGVVGVLGEVLITLGVLLLLLVAYQLWWTNVEANRAADQVAAELERSWAQPLPGDDGPGEPGDGDDGPAIPDGPIPGNAFARMYIPRLSDSVWGTPVVQGVTRPDLAKGIGHYITTAMPGEVGNFAVAGHRATNGEPLRDIDRLQVGDEVYVETRDTWFVYTLERDQIVRPTDTWVIAPVPWDPGAEPTQRLITVTTCHPRWASTERWIWWGTLAETIAKADEAVPEALKDGA
jgi:sortase A